MSETSDYMAGIDRRTKYAMISAQTGARVGERFKRGEWAARGVITLILVPFLYYMYFMGGLDRPELYMPSVVVIVAALVVAGIWQGAIKPRWRYALYNQERDDECVRQGVFLEQSDMITLRDVPWQEDGKGDGKK